MHRNHANEMTPMVYANLFIYFLIYDFTDHYVVETNVMNSKYWLAQSYIQRRLIIQINIPSNLQANIEQVAPALDKYKTKYYIESITFNLSNKANHLWNDMITVLSASFVQVSATQTELSNWPKNK